MLLGNTINTVRDPLKAGCKLCPECGASMAIVEQRRENGALFTWYQCTKAGCDGQWLEKEIFTSCKRI